MLFKDAPDLMAEFSAFLPPESGPLGQVGPAILPQPSGPSAAWNQNDLQMSSPAAVPAKKPTQASKRKKKVIEKDPTPVPTGKVAPSRVCPCFHTAYLLFMYLAVAN